ncbi:hypothetical protein ACFWZT_00780 [Streptomyces alboflavus]|uniref:hypothetical protein n=1 Tax=Streptomyces alboflavus TaxID=67267 RepID=UPI0036C8448A
MRISNTLAVDHRVLAYSFRMGNEVQLLAVSGPFFALLSVLMAAAVAHPEPEIRTRAERVLSIIFRAR